MLLIELPWFAHRPVWHLIFGGVLERHPRLRVVLTEQGVAWLPRGLETLDWFYRRMTLPEAAESLYFGAVAAGMSMTPSEYFHRNFWVGASFLRPSEAPLRYDVGLDRIMWGADYPHSEGSYGFTTEALRAAFGGLPEAEVRAMVETNAAGFFGFDLEALRPLADEIGPSVEAVAEVLAPADYPKDSTCNAFDTQQVLRAW
jgi:predicted TIM-barrel fold metal-dependent hydrolase